MLPVLRYRAQLPLIALAVSWQLLAMMFGWLADGPGDSVLYASMERGLLLLAMVPLLGATLLILWRLVPRDAELPSHSLPIGCGAILAVAATCWMATSFADARAGLYALAAALAVLLALDRHLSGTTVEPQVPGSSARNFASPRRGN